MVTEELDKWRERGCDIFGFRKGLRQCATSEAASEDRRGIVYGFEWAVSVGYKGMAAE